MTLGEATSMTLVRGGNTGENLYLLDHTPLIYVHHIGGHMSVFNPDMISDIEVYKGGFPTKYGGRLSSIMNISQKSGNKQAFRGSYSLGVTDLSFTLEGPGVQENSSFIVTARKTLIDFYYLLITGLSDMQDAFLFYGFHDINGKYTWTKDSRNSFALNFYHGDDYLQMFSKKPRPTEGRFRRGNTWGNTLASANWNHVLPSNVMLRNTLSFTRYRLRNTYKLTYNTEPREDWMINQEEKQQSAVQDLSLCSDASYALRKDVDLDFGFKTSYLRFKPMWLAHGSSRISDFKEIINATESALYISAKSRPAQFLEVEGGFRGAFYATSGFTKFSLEPRLNANLRLGNNHSLNLSATRMSQNAQMLYNVGSLMANEIYVPSGKDIPVAYSNQFTFGYQTAFADKMYEFEAGVYYKNLMNLTTYKDGYGYAMGDIYWREKLVTGGTGIAQGFELMFKKAKGKFTGFVAYTYSNSTRQYDEINKGKTYTFEYESPHDLAISLSYQISEKWSFGATWQYQTGLPFTPAIGRYNMLDEEGNLQEVLIYGDKNSERMRDYHRMDISFKKRTYTKKRHRKKEVTFGIYNVYNRQNPYFYYYSNDLYGGIHPPSWNMDGRYDPIKLYQISMFSFIPMISYKVWFGADSKKW